MNRPRSLRNRAWRWPAPWLCLGLAARAFCAETNAPPAHQTRALDYMIVVTGEELLRGVYPDGHTAFLTRTLQPLGCHCVGSMVVDDKPQDVKEALRLATQKAPLVLVTGGLGPTINDITREALADFTGIALREHKEVLAEMEKRFRQPREQLRPNLLRQTLVPVNGSYLKNPAGTAVGLVFERGTSVIVALPGPPRELQPMARNELIPYLRQRFGLRASGSSVTLRFVGAGQSLIDQTIRDRVPLPPDVMVSSVFEGSRVDFTFFVPGHAPADEERVKQLAARIRRELEAYCYGEGEVSLEEHVVNGLRTRGATLVLAEVGSGGHLVSSLHAVPNLAGLLTGAFVAPTEERLRQMLGVADADWPASSAPPDRAKALGAAARKQTRSNWVVVVGAVSTDERGAPGVPVALGLPNDRWELARLGLQGSGELPRANLTTQILDRWRKLLK
jgi:nicotinamide-nucleotide amidase